MSAPRRIQRQRTKGWRMPPGAVYVGRGSRWGNPYAAVPSSRGWWVTESHTMTLRRPLSGAEHSSEAEAWRVALSLYRTYLLEEWAPGHSLAVEARAELVGRDLVCWCPLDQPCHGDVLLEIANGPRECP